MVSLSMLRQQASAMGIADAEVRKYGDIRHKRTWTLAIEHHQQTQSSANQPNAEIELQDNSIPKPEIEIEIEFLPELIPSPPQNNIKARTRIKQDRGFEQVVQNHIKALRIASVPSENQSHAPIRNWFCPECSGQGLNCYLCQGAGNVDDIAARGWTLAYMEMLGCSPTEIAPLRSLSPSLNTLTLSLEVCIALKESSDILNRTEKLIAL
ncbi:MAG TPA: hypothetical protein VK211_03545 [Kamptonema sp.]|nr:hypothetical protein [Kamptonema sp.]